jgi:hypothetical protein
MQSELTKCLWMICIYSDSRYGTPPSDLETCSLWLTSYAPLSQNARMELLRSKNTKVRLDQAVEAIRSNPAGTMITSSRRSMIHVSIYIMLFVIIVTWFSNTYLHSADS